MLRTLSRGFVLFLLPVTLIATSHLLAAEKAAELLPASTVVYVELAQPAETIQTILNLPIADKVREHEAYQQATKIPQYKQFQAVLKFAEAQLGMKWLEAVSKLTAGGISVAFDAETQGLALILAAESADSLENLKTKVMGFARQDATNKGKDDPYEEHDYRGVTVYKADKVLFTTHDNWLVVVNKPELGRHLLDRLLDGPQDSLADQANFKTAYKSSQNKIVWGFANLVMIRDSGMANKAFEGKADDPGLELILGGVMEILPHASYVTASLDGLPEKLRLNVSLPFQSDWISENREHYFGPGAQGRVTSVRTAGEPILSLSVYRNLSEMWLRAGDLFNEKVNDDFAKADATLSTLFSGKDFGEDILASLSPEMQIVVSRQEFSEDGPTPAIKLPSFALVTRLKDPEATGAEFQRLYMSFMGFLNVTGGAEGRPQFDIDLESNDSGRIISTRVVPLAGREPQEQTSIAFNFSPTMAIQDDLFILASSSVLARDLLSSKEIPIESDSLPSDDARINLTLDLKAQGIRKALEDNREHLIAQNMLEKGHSREESEGEIGVLFEVLKLIDSAGVRVSTTNESFDARLTFQFAE